MDWRERIAQMLAERDAAIAPGAPQPGDPGYAGANLAAVRTNNPGAQGYNKATAPNFGAEPQRTGAGFSIAKFPTPTHGAASNLELYARNYTDKSIKDALHTWSGGGRREVAGYPADTVVTKDMMQDPKFAIPMMQALSVGETSRQFPMSQAQWELAHKWAMQGNAPLPPEAQPAPYDEAGMIPEQDPPIGSLAELNAWGP